MMSRSLSLARIEVPAGAHFARYFFTILQRQEPRRKRKHFAFFNVNVALIHFREHVQRFLKLLTAFRGKLSSAQIFIAQFIHLRM
jgi:hypothetical protein